MSGSAFPLTSGGPKIKPWLTLCELLTGSSFVTRVTDINWFRSGSLNMSACHSPGRDHQDVHR